jgi:RimJ/RimL family protein N-acetyltransferase
MKTDICPDLLEQIEWFDRKPHNFYWVIHFGDKPIGLINLADMQPQHRRTGFGFYIGEHDRCHLGGMVLPYFYNYVFNSTCFERIYAEVFGSNSGVYCIHMIHGFDVAGRFHNHIYKNGIPHHVNVMVLEKQKWLANSRYSTFTAEFE